MAIDISAYEASFVLAIIAVLFALKKVGVPSKFLPTISLIIGVAACAFQQGFTVEACLAGLLIGGLAVGVHSGTKNSIEAYLFGPTGEGKETKK